MARPAKDLDLVALQELVGTDGQMAVEISRNVSAVPGREDFEHVAAWSITHDAISNGELYENLRRFAGGCDGTGAYHFKATKPGVRAKPVEWEMRLPGAPRAPAHVQAEDAAKRQQQQATGQAAWPPAPGTFPQGAPVSSMPVGGGGGMGGYGGFMPMMGPWGMMPGMPGMGMGMYPGPQQPAQPSGPLGELGLILKPLIERLVAQPAVPVAPARDAEVEKLREEAQRAREEAARDRAEAARKFDELAAQRREDKLAADARLAEERAKADAVAARAEVDRRFADAKAEADRRHESLLAELKLAREEGGGKGKTNETVEMFKLMFQQQQSSASDQRDLLIKMLDAAGKREQYPSWMVEMFKEKNNPAQLESMMGAYSRLFEMTSHLTQAQIASVMDRVGDNQSPVMTALMGAFEKLGDIGKTFVEQRGQAAQAQAQGALAGARQPDRQLPPAAPVVAPPVNGANGRATVVASDFGALTEAVDNLRQAQIKGLPAADAASKIVEMIDFGDSFGLKGVEALLALAKDPAALIAKLLPAAPTDYQKATLDVMQAILAEGAKGAAPAGGATPADPAEPPAN